MGTNSTEKPPFLVAATPRTGFHFFKSLLYPTHRIGHIGHLLGELLESYRDVPYADLPDQEILNVFETIRENYESRGTYTEKQSGIYGTKLEYVLWLPFVIRFFELKGFPLNSAKWIWVYRKDLIRQAISCVHAGNKKIFFVHEDDPPEIKAKNAEIIDVPIDELACKLLSNYLSNLFWGRFFEKHGIEPHVVVYEDFVDPSTWAAMVRGVLQFLEIDTEGIGDIFTTYTKQSNDAHVAEVEREFFNEYVGFDVNEYLSVTPP